MPDLDGNSAHSRVAKLVRKVLPLLADDASAERRRFTCCNDATQSEGAGTVAREKAGSFSAIASFAGG